MIAINNKMKFPSLLKKIDALKSGKVDPDFKRSFKILFLVYIVFYIFCFSVSVISPNSFSKGIVVMDIVVTSVASLLLFAFLLRKINLQQASFVFSCVITIDLIVSDLFAILNGIAGWEYIIFRDGFVFAISLIVTAYICGYKTIIVQSLMYELMLVTMVVFFRVEGFSIDAFLFLMLLVFGFSFGVVIHKQNMTKILRKKLFLQKEISEQDKKILQKEVELTSFKSESLKQMLQQKERELTSHALIIARYNERDKLLQKKIQKLTSVKDDKMLNVLKEIEVELSNARDPQSWGTFQKCFEEVHPDFSKKILELSPSLSPAERKLSTLIRLGLTSKEIASLTYTTKASVDVARSRLRKRFQLDRNENIEAFLVGL